MGIVFHLTFLKLMCEFVWFCFSVGLCMSFSFPSFFVFVFRSLRDWKIGQERKRTCRKTVEKEKNAHQENKTQTKHCTSCLIASWRYSKFAPVVTTHFLSPYQHVIWQSQGTYSAVQYLSLHLPRKCLLRGLKVIETKIECCFIRKGKNNKIYCRRKRFLVNMYIPKLYVWLNIWVALVVQSSSTCTYYALVV